MVVVILTSSDRAAEILGDYLRRGSLTQAMIGELECVLALL